jgi:hypothetical protein
MPMTTLGERGPAVSQIGLGLAALGRPAYITSGRQEDLPATAAWPARGDGGDVAEIFSRGAFSHRVLVAP